MYINQRDWARIEEHPIVEKLVENDSNYGIVVYLKPFELQINAYDGRRGEKRTIPGGRILIKTNLKHRGPMTRFLERIGSHKLHHPNVRLEDSCSVCLGNISPMISYHLKNKHYTIVVYTLLEFVQVCNST